MDYIITNIVPIGAAMVVGLGILLLSARARFTPARGVGAALALFWLAAILAGALILAPVTASGWTIALGSAFIIWIGFVLPALAIGLVLRGHPVTTCMTDAGWWLAIMLAQAATMHVIGLIHPAQPRPAVSAHLPAAR